MNTASHDLQLASVHRNLLTLVLLRWCFLAVVAICLLLAHSQLHLSLAYPTLVWLLSGFVVLNGITHWRLRCTQLVRRSELLAQLCVDIACLSILLYFTGGATNPFVSYLLVPICIAAMTLPLPLTLLTAVLATLSYWWLLSFFIPVESLTPSGGHHAGHGATSLHIYGMWLNFILSAGIIAAFVSRIANQLRASQKLSQAQREQVLHAEQLTTIATLTAGTAHELGTPLSTIKIAAQELCQTNLPETLRADVQVINQQIDLCQAALARLRDQARSGLKLEPEIVSAKQWLQQTLAQWSLINPNAQLSHNVSALPDSAHLSLDPTLAQSLVNLLHNAVQHTQHSVQLRAHTQGDQLWIDIQDSGPALPESVVSAWGKPFNSERALGMGLGLFLSNSTVERHGGELQMIEQAGGKIMRILLPLYGAK